MNFPLMCVTVDDLLSVLTKTDAVQV